MIFSRVHWNKLMFRGISINFMLVLILLTTFVITIFPLNTAYAAPAPPRYTYSFYMEAADPDVLFQMGCNQGTVDRATGVNQDELVILDFGQPALDVGTYGTYIFSPTNDFTSVSEIEQGVEAFASGFYGCTLENHSHVTIIVGTNNLKGNFGQVNFAHGDEWLQLSTRVWSWLSNTGYLAQVDVDAGSDMELGYATPAATRSWVTGFTSSAVGTTRLFNYGDAAGCPTTTIGNCTTTLFSGGTVTWTPDDIWFISWGANSAWPFPEIYAANSSQAKQWHYLSLNSARNHPSRGRMNFIAVLTQNGACSRPGANCSGPPRLDNSPGTGWSQLYDEVNNDPATAIVSTYQAFKYSSDIRYQYQ